MDSKFFHLGDVLSIITGRVLSLRGIDGIYDILNFMTKDNLFTHQLPRASEECKPYLLKQHPQLADIGVSALSEENFNQWIADEVVKYGEWFEIEPIPENGHHIINPATELVEMMKE